MLLEIAPANDGDLLPACTPSLMPFHISYTGPAPISRYFRPRPAPPSLATLSLRSSSTATVAASSSSIMSETQSSLTAVSSNTSIGSLTLGSECGKDELSTASTPSIEVVKQAAATQLAVDTATEMDLDTQPVSDTALDSSKSFVANRLSGNAERFVAAFRGRQMYGQAVDVPSGYGGLVLRTPFDSKGKRREDADMAKPRSKTRASKRRLKRDGGDDSDGDIDPPPRTRTLAPSSTFSSLMLWTPDRPLDEGRDEYARALVEWTRLATEIHSYDE